MRARAHTHTHTHSLSLSLSHTNTHTHGLAGSGGGTKGGGPSSQSRRGAAGDRLRRQEHQDLYAAIDAAGIGTLIRALDGHSTTINARLERHVRCACTMPSMLQARPRADRKTVGRVVTEASSDAG